MNIFEKDVLTLLENNNLRLEQFAKQGSKCLPILDDEHFCLNFYQKHKHEINYFLQNYFFTRDDFDYIKEFDHSDPLILEANNQQIITIFAIEELVYLINKERGLEL